MRKYLQRKKEQLRQEERHKIEQAEAHAKQLEALKKQEGDQNRGARRIDYAALYARRLGQGAVTFDHHGHPLMVRAIKNPALSLPR